MSSSSPITGNELSTRTNNGSADSSPFDMAHSEESPPKNSSPEDSLSADSPLGDSPSDSSLAVERLNRYIEDESTSPTTMLSLDTRPSQSTQRIESEINAFDDAFGDDRNGTAEHEDGEKGDEKWDTRETDKEQEEEKEGESK